MVGQEFPSTDFNSMPPIHPYCRCTTLPVLDSISSENATMAGLLDGGAATSSASGVDLLREMWDAGATLDSLNLGGSTGEVHVGTLLDGSRVAVKTTDIIGAGSLRNEESAQAVLEALGIDYTNAFLADSTTLVTRFIEGQSGAEWLEAQGLTDPTLVREGTASAITSLNGAKELGVFDFITSNVDRHAFNWIVQDNTVVGIDHGSLYWWGSGMRDMAMTPFSEAVTGLTSQGGKLAPTISRAELDAMRPNLEALKDRLSESNYTNMMAKFNKLWKAAS
jgi:hypothetical protein